VKHNVRELEDIAMSIPSISNKAKMLSFISVAKTATVKRSDEEDNKVAQEVADWIERTWPTHTVRAKMAQKIAKMIREGEWKTQL